MAHKVLSVQDLHVTFSTYGGTVKAVRGVSFDLYKGETFAIVGESGCGKSVTSQTVMGLLPKHSAKIESGSIQFKQKDLCKLPEREMRAIRGRDISMIFQDPMTALNPTLTVGDQLSEALLEHRAMTKKQAEAEVLSMLGLVGIPDSKARLKQYPHQLSGGMRQRIVIAMALICEPEIMIADEPTTALDVTIQAQILELFKEIQRKTGVSIILITHDLGVVAQVADRVAVMYGGKIAEIGTRHDIFYHPNHPYTKGLLHSVPRLDMEGAELVPIDGTPPDLFDPPAGCPFAARCPDRMIVCEKVYPETTVKSKSHMVNCWLQDERAEQRVQKQLTAAEEKGGFR
ncbi:ABC transporter ATP-binding protein [Bacillus nakamurai]|uniref:ABC transporter ATP-binding protein n=1 Tax=Bacillus nakamurai TaxID=1793963 RepID=UPI0020C2BBB2|nr:ABC transporter ATP-binding protein [Bacillus nakamurai]MCP6682796.1 ABC transporter ATP-binding protein [Bacillus nakamurai]